MHVARSDQLHITGRKIRLIVLQRKVISRERHFKGIEELILAAENKSTILPLCIWGFMGVRRREYEGKTLSELSTGVGCDARMHNSLDRVVCLRRVDSPRCGMTVPWTMIRRRTDDGDGGGATTATWERRSGRERIGGF